MSSQRITDRVTSVLDKVSVEPLLFLFTIACALLGVASKALVYHKVCISHYDPDLCAKVDNGSFPDEEQLVQSESSFWFLAETYLNEVSSLVMSFFYGSLSDRYGRKLALILPVTGQIINALIHIFNAVFIRISVAALLPGAFIGGLFGGWTSINIGAFGLLSDITSPQQRTTRMSLAESGIFVSSAIGHSVSGLVVDKSGFVSVFCMAGGIHLLSLLYILLRIKEHRKVSPSSSSRCDTCMSILTGSYRVLRKKRRDRKRTYIFVILLTIFLVIVSNRGKSV